MKLNLFTSFLLLCIYSTQAVELSIDSLKNELNELSDDKEKLSCLINISSSYLNFNLDSALYYGRIADKKANEIGDSSLINKSIFTLAKVFHHRADYDEALKYYKKNLDYYRKVKQDSNLSSVLGNMGLIYQNRNELDKALELYKKSLSLDKLYDNKSGIIYNLTDIGYLYYLKSEFVIAQEYYNEGLKIIEDGEKTTEFISLKASLNDKIAQIFYTISDLDNALKYYFKAVEIYKSLNQEYYLSSIYHNISFIYSSQNNAAKSMEYLKKSRKLESDSKDYYSLFSTEIAIANSYLEMKNDKKAMEIIDSVITKNNEYKYDRIYALAYSNKATIYVYTGELDRAYQNFNISLELFRKLKTKHEVARVKAEIGKILILLSDKTKLDAIDVLPTGISKNPKKNLEKGISYLEKILEDELYKTKTYYLDDLYLELSKAYEKQGDYKKAFRTSILYLDFIKSSFNEKKMIEFGRVEARHNISMEELRNERETQRILQEKRESDSRRNALQYLGITFFVIGFILLIIFSGKLKMREWVAKALVFITFIFLFEFISVIFDPMTDRWSGGEPLLKFAMNLSLALVIYPIHKLLEKRAKSQVLKPQIQNMEKIMEEFKTKKKVQNNLGDSENNDETIT